MNKNYFKFLTRLINEHNIIYNTHPFKHLMFNELGNKLIAIEYLN